MKSHVKILNRLVKVLFIFSALLFFNTAVYPEVTVKLKDVSFIDGLKVNQVFGYGLVVGLQGTGDSRSPLTKSSLKNFLKNLGIEGDDFVSKNTAAVLLTAKLPVFVRIGDRIDITVSSIGDAKSLEGGILVQSPLRGADNKIYAVVQGSLSIPKPSGGGRGIKTVAIITGGGVIEREIVPDIVINNSIFIVLKNWDYSMANGIINSVVKKFPQSKPKMTNSGKIKINIDKSISLAEFISSIENLEIASSNRAIVVVNERNGTIVSGGGVKISEAIVSKEGVTVEIANSDKKGAVAILKESATVKDLVDSLNSIGASTRDIISILKALKEAGALHAELVVN